MPNTWNLEFFYIVINMFPTYNGNLRREFACFLMVGEKTSVVPYVNVEKQKYDLPQPVEIGFIDNLML